MTTPICRKISSLAPPPPKISSYATGVRLGKCYKCWLLICPPFKNLAKKAAISRKPPSRPSPLAMTPMTDRSGGRGEGDRPASLSFQFLGIRRLSCAQHRVCSLKSEMIGNYKFIFFPAKQESFENFKILKQSCLYSKVICFIFYW